MTGGPVVACPRIVDGVVYIGSSDHVFRAIDLATGRLVWSQDGIEGFVETKPLVAGGLVVFGAWDGRLYALDALTGRPGLDLDGGEAEPVLLAGRLLARRGERARLHRRAQPVDDGHRARHGRGSSGAPTTGPSANRSGSPPTAPASTSGRPRTSSPRSRRPPTDAEAVWETDAGVGHDINSAMLVEKDGVVFYGTKNGLLLALDGATGAIKWKHRVGVALLNTVTPLSGREVVVTDFDGRVTLVASDK